MWRLSSQSIVPFAWEPAKTVNRFLTAAILSFIASCAVSVLLAQSYYSGVRGTIRDPNGRAVPAAKVSLSDELTGVGRSTVTSADGEYAFNQVIPSRARISMRRSDTAVNGPMRPACHRKQTEASNRG